MIQFRKENKYVQVWIHKDLKNEIDYALKNLKEKYPEKKISFREASKRLGKYLNTLRNNKL